MKKFTIVSVILLIACVAAFAGVADGSRLAPPNSVVTSLNLQTSGSTLTGTADGVAISNGKVEGAIVFFNLTRNGVLYALKGTVSGGGARLELHQTKASDGSGHAAVILSKQ